MLPSFRLNERPSPTAGRTPQRNGVKWRPCKPNHKPQTGVKSAKQRSICYRERTLRLVLGLSTGAAVLMINLLATQQHLPRSASWLFLASILFFVAAAIICVLLLLQVTNLRWIVIDAILDESSNWRQASAARQHQWKRRSTTLTVLWACVFGLGFLFALVAVISPPNV